MLPEQQQFMLKLLSKLTHVLTCLDEQSNSWLDEHLLIKLLFDLGIVGLTIGILIWFISLCTYPIDQFSIAVLLIGATILYTAWAISITLLHMGIISDNHET